MTAFEKLVRYELRRCGLTSEKDVQDYLYVLEYSVDEDLGEKELRDFNEIRKAVITTTQKFAHQIDMEKMKKRSRSHETAIVF
ncbi:MAG: hypothetical protein PF637_05845 [Spirochaetes bacterium]|jgi:hypothetical protein|nr:hypothetical protein [Spirochaetota bacterium]